MVIKMFLFVIVGLLLIFAISLLFDNNCCNESVCAMVQQVTFDKKPCCDSTCIMYCEETKKELNVGKIVDCRCVCNINWS